MTAGELMNWAALLQTGALISKTAYDGVKHLATKELSTHEMQQVLTLWHTNAERSRVNAGLPPVVPPPIEPAPI